MNRVISLLLFALFVFPCSAAVINVKIDERVELTSIVFRLAGDETYSSDVVPDYINEVDSWFGKYSSHPLITYLKSIREHNDTIGCSTAAQSAFMFDIEDGKIHFDIKDDPQSIIQKYWHLDSLRKYLQLLSKFYKDTKFEMFWERQQPRIKKSIEFSENTIREMNLDFNWLESFFNEKMGELNIYVAMLNGYSNYANVNVDYISEKGNSVFIGCCEEKDGVPKISKISEAVLIHEICHCLGNGMLGDAKDQFISNFKNIFPCIREITEKYGYSTPGSVACESLIDLFKIAYLMKAKHCDCGWEIAKCEERGYYWMSDLVRFMDNYFANRCHYQSIKEFMPQIVAYYNELPERFDDIMKNNITKSPYVESTYPAKGSTVSADIKEIRIMLSRPVIECFGTRPIEGFERILHNYTSIHRSDDHRTIIITLTKALEKDKAYGIKIPEGHIIAEDTHHRSLSSYVLLFQTE